VYFGNPFWIKSGTRWTPTTLIFVDAHLEKTLPYPNLINYEKPVVEKGGVIISYTISVGEDSEIGLADSHDPKTKSCVLALSEFEKI